MKRFEERIRGFFETLAFFSILVVSIGARAAVGDDAQLVSVSVPAGTQVMPRTVFTQSWTLKNIGTNTWTPGQSGYTMNIQGTDSLGACRLVPNTVASAYHPSATISSGLSVPPGGQATFKMSFVAPEAAGPGMDTFQLNGAGGNN